MNFPGFAGNSEVKAALSAAFASRRFPHAIILQGENGCGKRTLAGLIAKALVCQNRESAPCGECPSCIRAAAGSHPDIRIVEGSGVSRSLTVDAVKSVIADAYRMPEEADVNVYILLLGDRSPEAAQNKLLKVIEEPPENTVFILVCRFAEQLLPTIRSRAQSFTLLPPPPEEASAWIQKRLGLAAREADRLTAQYGGNIGRMLEEAENGGADQSLAIAAEMVQAMLSPEGGSLLKAAAPLQKDRKLCGDVLSRLGTIFRDACVLRAGGNSLLGGAPEEADRLQSLPMKRLSALPGIAEEFQQKLERNANMPLLVTCLCVRLRETLTAM